MSSFLPSRDSAEDILNYLSPLGSPPRIDPGQLVKSGQLKELKHLIHHARVIARTWREANAGKRSLLHIAAAFNQVEIISYLVDEARLSINLQDSDGNTPLHLAVTNGHTEATKAILNHRASDNICNSDMDPPLHVAIKQGSQGIGVLLEFINHPSVDIFVRGVYNYTTLHVIAQTDNTEALKLIHDKIVKDDSGLYSKISLKNRNGLTFFHLAALVGSHNVLEFLLSKSADYRLDSKELLGSLSSENRSPMHYAVERAHIECVRILLKYGSDPTSLKGGHPPPLHLACSQGNMDAIRLMVDSYGQDVLQSRDMDGGTALHSSTSSIHSKELISYLVENGVRVNDVDNNGFSPLINAVQLGSISAVEELMRLGADPLIKDMWGNNSLHRAVMGKRIEVFKAVIASGSATALTSSADNHGNYPIHLALKQGLAEMVSPLMEMSPQMFRDGKGSNYMHLAAISSDERSLVHLLSMPSAKHMINEADCEGLTPLHYAAMGCSITAVRKLIDHGAVIHRSNSGLTPFMCACSKGNLEAAQFLYGNNKFQRDWVDHCGCTALHAAVVGGNPQLITFCLDEGMAITLNDYQLSFLDEILNQNNKKLAKAAISHMRWIECIDICCPDKPHPILRILDQMPDVYGIILDNCFTKSPFDRSHHDYWEEFNFKCLDLKPEPSDVLGDGKEERNGTRDLELDELNLTEQYDAIHTQLHTASDVAVEDMRKVQQYRNEAIQQQRRHVLSRWWRRRERERAGTLLVIRKLIKNRHRSYLLHPVVMSYIKMKWVGFGMYVHLVTMLMHFLLALFFSIFVVAIPQPQQNFPTSENGSNNSMKLDSGSISSRAEVLLFICLVLAVLSLVLVAREVYVHGVNLIIDFTTEFQTWSNFIASINVIIFLVSILAGGLSSALWNAGALGVFFAWATCTFSLQFIGALNMGVYIIMIMSTARLVLKVLGIFLIFIFAFTFAFYVLVGSIEELQYNTVGLSLYSNLHAMIAVSDYLGFANLQQVGRIRFSIMTFLLLVVLIIMLPIVFINVLIGLAVGDIAKIQKEAIITRQKVEVRALATLETRLVPRWCKKYISKRCHKHYPNRPHFGVLLTKFFHQTFDTSDTASSSPGVDSSDRELKELRQELAEEREFCRKALHQLQEGLKLLSDDQSERMKKLEAMLAKSIAPQGQDTAVA